MVIGTPHPVQHVDRSDRLPPSPSLRRTRMGLDPILDPPFERAPRLCLAVALVHPQGTRPEFCPPTPLPPLPAPSPHCRPFPDQTRTRPSSSLAGRRTSHDARVRTAWCGVVRSTRLQEGHAACPTANEGRQGGTVGCYWPTSAPMPPEHCSGGPGVCPGSLLGPFPVALPFARQHPAVDLLALPTWWRGALVRLSPGRRAWLPSRK